MPAAAAQNHSANQRSAEVAITTATSSATSAPFASHTGEGTPRPAGSSASRNSAAPGICAARASGHRAKAPAVSSPYRAARPSGTGYTPIDAGTGSMSPNSHRPSSGIAAPAATPIATPAAHSRPTCSRNTRRMSPAGAPRQRSVATVRARASIQARTPVATPMPPTSSEQSPTSVRNSAVWSTARSTPGAAVAASRMRHPEAGKSRRIAAVSALASPPGGSTTRHS